MDYNLTLFKDSVRDILLSPHPNQTNTNNNSSQDTTSTHNLTNSLAANLSLNGDMNSVYQ
jgi:hypothetical protein